MDNDDRRPNSNWDPDAQYPARPPVSQRTYWVRRTFALLILIAMIVVVVLGIKALVKAVTGPSESKELATIAEPEGAAPDGEPAQPEPEKSAESEPSPEPSTEQAGPHACTPQSIETVITAGSTQFPAVTTNQFSVVTKYLGTEACTLDVGAAARPVTVFSGDDRIWSSADCDEAGARVLMMAKGVQDTSQVDWDMVRSDKNCTPDLPAAKPGTYRAVVTFGDTDSEPFVFNVVP